MCPERHILSAFVDGEVPSPWRERVERHVASCEACSQVAERYRSLSARVKEGEPSDLDGAAEAVLDRVAMGARRRSPASVWSRRVSMPLPFAAAAAIAVAALGGVALGQVAFAPSAKPTEFASAQTLRLPPQAAQVAMPGGAVEASMANVEPTAGVAADVLDRILNGDAQVTITINLPDKATVSEPVQPVIVKGTPTGGPGH